MNSIECWEIKGGLLEYFDDTHTYVYNGVILPSITQILHTKFKDMYTGISKEVLNRAAQLGSTMHKQIEDYEQQGIVSDSKECRNYIFLKKHYKWVCKANERPIVLFYQGRPIAAGRLDMILEKDGRLFIGDLKRTSVLYKEYVTLQTNLYRIGYQECYGETIEGLCVIHLREDKRKFVELPINENMALEVIEEFLKGEKNEPST